MRGARPFGRSYRLLDKIIVGLRSAVGNAIEKAGYTGIFGRGFSFTVTAFAFDRDEFGEYFRF
jgi:hypothetical protein